MFEVTMNYARFSSLSPDGSVHPSALESRARWLSSSSRLVDLLDEAERNEFDMKIRETVKDLYDKAIEFGESLKKS